MLSKHHLMNLIKDTQGFLLKLPMTSMTSSQQQRHVNNQNKLQLGLGAATGNESKRVGLAWLSEDFLLDPN
jgi:hypothetical protein